MDRSKNLRGGFTLTELMASAAIISVGILVLMSVFGGLHRLTSYAKFRTLAANVAQEKMQVLKEQNYFRTLVTTLPDFDTNFTPTVPFDTVYYPAETLLEGGMRFTRYTLVEYARETAGAIVTLPPGSNDTGMKLITVTVVWNQAPDWRKYTVTNVLTNPNMVTSNSAFIGTVRSSGAGTPALPNALVNIAENMGWQSYTNASGQYNVGLNAGSYNLKASAQGFYDQTFFLSVAANATVTQNFSLTPIATGTITGAAYLTDHLVLSQVVGSTMDVSNNNFDQEYVEIFNPSTYTWNLNGDVGLRFQRRTVQDPNPIDIEIVYITTYVASFHYFLYANTPTLHVAGMTLNADAVWDSTVGGANDIQFPHFDPTTSPASLNIITVREDPDDPPGEHEGAASVTLFSLTKGQLDLFGWRGAGALLPPANYESAAFHHGQVQGLNRHECNRRFSSPAGDNSAYGPAYDSNNNDKDWGRISPFVEPPRTSASTGTVVSGTPATGAIVSANDNLSDPVTATLTNDPPYAAFTLTNVATGTWVVFVSSNARIQEISNVTVVNAGDVIQVPNAGTTPSWPAANFNVSILTEDNGDGFVSGWVRDGAGAAINPSIVVSFESGSGNASIANGRYLLRLPPNTYNITANPGPGNTFYVSETSQSVVAQLGMVTSDVNFTLTQGGQIRGLTTRDGVNPVPGVAFTATDVNGIVQGNQVTASDGRFTMINLSTGLYTVEPILGSGEISAPVSATVTVAAGSSVFSASFTVTGALGHIAGTVKTSDGNPISTGVLLVASTSTVAASPPALSSTTLTGSAYYMGASNEDGTFILDVRGDAVNTYKLYGYYTTKIGTTIAVSTQSAVGIAVNQGATTSGVNLTW